jgi:type I restriction enzyme M protein
MTGDDLTDFVDDSLFPYLQKFTQKATGPNTIEYKIGQIFGEIKSKIQSGHNLREIIDHIDELRFRSQKEKHELSHLYEAKIRNMGNAGRNGGEYYTPRPLIRAMIKVVKPELGQRIYDGAVGSAGFLCEAYDYLKAEHPKRTSAQDKFLHEKTFYGKEKKSLAYVIAIMNMILHGIEAQHAHGEPRRHPGEGPLRHHPGQSALRREGALRSPAQFPHPHRRNRLSLPPALHQDAQSRRPGRRGDHKHLLVEHR